MTSKVISPLQGKQLPIFPNNRSLLSPEQEPPPQFSDPQNSAIIPSTPRRHSPKGHACGWIEERRGNLSRKTPSISYYYCWQTGEQRGKCYIPIRKLAMVEQMLRDRCSVDDVLTLLSKQK